MKNNRLIFFLSLILFQFNIIAQSPNWLWAKSAGGQAKDQSFSISKDVMGNVFITGYFMSPTITFGSITLNNAGGRTVFVVKYDPSGNVLWAKSVGGSGDEEGFGICTDATGNVYITGYFASASLTFGTSTLTCAGSHDIFIAKFDASGTPLWAKSAGGSTSDDGNAITVDQNGNVAVTGYFTSPTISFGSASISSAGTFDAFIVKYDPSGSVLWAKPIGALGIDLGFDTAIDGLGNIFVTGNCSAPNLVVGTSTITLTGGSDLFIMKFDPSGLLLWARSGGGGGNKFSRSIAIVSAANAVITGDFDGPSLVFGTYTLTSSGSTDIFTVKYDGAGNVLWAKSFGGSASEYGLAMCDGPLATTYITGYSTSPSLTVGTNTYTNAGSEDIFILKYDGSGNIVWLKTDGGSGSELGSGVVADNSGSIWLTGSLSSTPLSLGTTNLNCAGILDPYVAKTGGATVDILETKADLSHYFFPNPFSHHALLQFSHELKNASLIIQNNLGEVVSKTMDLNGESITFSRNKLAAGVYFYSVVEKNQTIAAGKFIVRDE